MERAGGDTQWNNLYLYCVHNPKTFSDPMGLDWASDLWGGAQAVWSGFVSIVMFIPNEIVSTINWYASASDAERWGFWAGIGSAIVVGVAIGLSCVFAACVGLVLLAAGSSAFLLGSVASSFAYMAVTQALGGTPTSEGIGHSFFWGGFAAGLGFGGAFRAGEARGLGPRSEAPKLAQPGKGGFANGRATERTATGNERFTRYYDTESATPGAAGSGPRGHWATTDSPTKSSMGARLLYRLDFSGNKALLGETLRLEQETKYYVGRLAGSFTEQVWVEKSSLWTIEGARWGMRGL